MQSEKRSERSRRIGIKWKMFTILLLFITVVGVVIWLLPQSWDFTRKLTWSKLLWCVAVFLLALAALTTQSYNPFIYFIF